METEETTKQEANPIVESAEDLIQASPIQSELKVSSNLKDSIKQSEQWPDKEDN